MKLELPSFCVNHLEQAAPGLRDQTLKTISQERTTEPPRTIG